MLNTFSTIGSARCRALVRIRLHLELTILIKLLLVMAILAVLSTIGTDFTVLDVLAELIFLSFLDPLGVLCAEVPGVVQPEPPPFLPLPLPFLPFPFPLLLPVFPNIMLESESSLCGLLRLHDRLLSFPACGPQLLTVMAIPALVAVGTGVVVPHLKAYALPGRLTLARTLAFVASTLMITLLSTAFVGLAASTVSGKDIGQGLTTDLPAFQFYGDGVRLLPGGGATSDRASRAIRVRPLILPDL